MNQIELLAPAGSMEALITAVQNGADAVYLGGTKFSARAYASNFTLTELEEAVDYCHSYQVRVHITLNTLLKDEELAEAIDYAKSLYALGVDALIVQDPGLIYHLRRELPDFPLHASTQLSVHNGEGALYYTEKGMTRIVLARELSLEEIRSISQDLGVETEVFVHGALCISYSGQCLMSSILGGRSGNRGRCAQPCRLPYDLLDGEGSSVARAYLMSPKDISAIDFMPQLQETGVSSLKIEGRMKKPEYVAATLRSFREELEGKKDPVHRENLLKIFNREGFSDGYFLGKHGKDMMSFSYPKNTGVPVGKVLEDGSLELTKPLRKGDGLRVKDKGLTVEGIRIGQDVREEASAGQRVHLLGRTKLPMGILYKTYDTLLMEEMIPSDAGKYDRKIHLPATLRFMAGEPAVLTATHEGKTYTKTTSPVQIPLKAPLSQERILEALTKSGDSPYLLDVAVETFTEGFLPVRELNELRRSLLEEILAEEVAKYKRSLPKGSPAPEEPVSNTLTEPLKLVGVSTKAQLTEALKLGAKAIMVYPFYRGEEYVNFGDVKNLLATPNHPDIYLRVSNILRQELHGVLSRVKALDGLSGLVTNNVGVIRQMAKTHRIIGDYKLNIFNSDALKLYGEDLALAMVSEELNRKELAELKNKAQLMTLVYGRQELMHSEYCPVGSTVGGMTKTTPCNEACMRQHYALKDRMDEVFPVMTDVFCRSYIMNGKPKNLLDTVKDLSYLGIRSHRIDLTVETPEESRKVIQAFLREEPLPLESFNRGHYKRGVE